MKIINRFKTTVSTFLVFVFFASSCTETVKKEENNQAPISNEVQQEVAVVTDEVVKEVADETTISEGKEIFDTKCTVCHKIEEKVIGPALKGVTTRRSDEWIIKMIVDPTAMLANDPDAKALLAEFNNVPMTPLGIDKESATKILAYFKSIE